jgi:hypothetical protein
MPASVMAERIVAERVMPERIMSVLWLSVLWLSVVGAEWPPNHVLFHAFDAKSSGAFGDRQNDNVLRRAEYGGGDCGGVASDNAHTPRLLVCASSALLPFLFLLVVASSLHPRRCLLALATANTVCSAPSLLHVAISDCRSRLILYRLSQSYLPSLLLLLDCRCSCRRYHLSLSVSLCVL